MNPIEALQLLLDHVDYTNLSCGPTEMVGAVLPKQVIDTCREVIRLNKAETNSQSKKI